MLQRVITGLVSAGVLIAVMLVRGWVLRLSLTVIAVWGMSEMFDAFQRAGHLPIRWPSHVAAALIIPAHLLLGDRAMLPMLALVLLLTMINITVREQPHWPDAGLALYVAFTALLPTMMLIEICDVQPEALGAWLTFGTFLIALLGDTVAFFVGITWGKRKLNPHLSPNKTVEGSLGGLAGSMIAGLLLWWLGGLSTAMPPRWQMLLLGLIGGLAGQMGDLSASLVKRWCSIKDFGVVFPGHGGIMDRFDSIFFTAYVVYAFCALVIL